MREATFAWSFFSWPRKVISGLRAVVSRVLWVVVRSLFLSGRMNSVGNKLAGASIYVVANDKGVEKGEILRAMIASLGGSLAVSMHTATHAIAVDDDGATTSAQKDELAICEALDVAIVDASWLDRVSSLPDADHWSTIQQLTHTTEKDAPAASGSGTTSSSSSSSTSGVQVPPPSLQRSQQRRKPPAPPAHPPPPPPPPSTKTVRRKDTSASLRDSIMETWSYFVKEHPDVVEEDQVRRAMELSMLDCALTVREPSLPAAAGGWFSGWRTSSDDPRAVLGVSERAGVSEITAAYRRRAREAHPDKGGDAATFARLARAYRTLLGKGDEGDDDPDSQRGAPLWIGKTTAQRDDELRDHRGLVDELFVRHGVDLDANVERQQRALEAIGLRAVEAGATNVNERNEPISNSCFYLSLASSYLDGFDGKTEKQGEAKTTEETNVKSTALRFKRLVESAVVRSHPDWASQGIVGENVQAFSDFLYYSLDSPTVIADLAVAVFDSTSGFVEIYKGVRYDGRDLHDQKANLITIRHLPGHYQPLLPRDLYERPSLAQLIDQLTANDVLFTVTDG